MGVVRGLPESPFGSSSSSRMMPSPSDADASDWAEVMDVLRGLWFGSGLAARAWGGPRSRSNDMSCVSGRKTSVATHGVAGPDTDGVAVAPNASSSGISSGTSHGWEMGNREILHDISGSGDARTASSGTGGSAFWATERGGTGV